MSRITLFCLTSFFNILDIVHKLKNTSRMYSCINNVDISQRGHVEVKSCVKVNKSIGFNIVWSVLYER